MPGPEGNVGQKWKYRKLEVRLQRLLSVSCRDGPPCYKLHCPGNCHYPWQEKVKCAKWRKGRAPGLLPLCQYQEASKSLEEKQLSGVNDISGRFICQPSQKILKGAKGWRQESWLRGYRWQSSLRWRVWVRTGQWEQGAKSTHVRVTHGEGRAAGELQSQGCGLWWSEAARKERHYQSQPAVASTLHTLGNLPLLSPHQATSSEDSRNLPVPGSPTAHPWWLPEARRWVDFISIDWQSVSPAWNSISTSAWEGFPEGQQNMSSSKRPPWRVHLN